MCRVRRNMQANRAGASVLGPQFFPKLQGQARVFGPPGRTVHAGRHQVIEIETLSGCAQQWRFGEAAGCATPPRTLSRAGGDIDKIGKVELLTGRAEIGEESSARSRRQGWQRRVLAGRSRRREVSLRRLAADSRGRG